MLGMFALLAVAMVLFRAAWLNSSPQPLLGPATLVVLPAIGGLAFALAAVGMLFQGSQGAAFGLAVGFVVGIVPLLFVLILDIRFLGGFSV
jgi:hypothetical protein